MSKSICSLVPKLGQRLTYTPMDTCVDRSVLFKTYFQHPRFEILIDENVKAEQFEADAFTRWRRAWSTRSVGGEEMRLGEKDRFDHHTLRKTIDVGKIIG